MSTLKIRLRIIVFAAGLVAASFLLVGASERSRIGRAGDISDYYKTQCVSCHGDQADLKFDQKLSDEELVRIVLKGKLVDVPPDMPAFEPKGITEEQAKSLVTYMRQLRKSASN
ncbi:MAG TPA: cytochrome c [Pyrinomonadaceae bacterium]|nr:cytochrome c [Pyrinomonadaceae bacterium]